MDERLVALVKNFIPDAEVKKIYKSPEGEIMVDVNAPGMGELSCTVKKNHAGELYLE